MCNASQRLAVFVASLSCFGSAFAASTRESLETSMKQLKSRRYEPAIRKTKSMLEALKLDTVEEIILAHKILGVSYCELGDQPRASEHFKALLTFSPTETIDDAVVTKPCADLYAGLKRDGDGVFDLPPVPAVPVHPAEPPRIEIAPPAVRQTAASAEKKTNWKLYIPFGVGQFENGQSSKGVAFLAAEATAAAAAVTMFALFQNEKGPDGTFAHPARASVYRNIYWGALGTGSAVAIAGILDAVAVHRLRVTEEGASYAFLF